MILLDTDHLSLLKYHESERAVRLTERLAKAIEGGESIATSIVSVEEQMRGWLAALAKERLPRRMVSPYRELAGLFDFFRGFTLALFTDQAADRFAEFGSIRIKVTDRKIAAIAIVHDALLLTANRRDFERIPGLRFENWLEEK
jgi:tRNA(fMet)-specific endonuclease VapC